MTNTNTSAVNMIKSNFFCSLVYAVCTITPDALVSQIDSKEMGKTELYTSFANSIVDILSQRLVIQCHYNEILLNLANVLLKNRGRFYCNLISKPLPSFHYLFRIGSI